MTDTVTLPTPPVPDKSRSKRRKVRRTTANESKRTALKNNEKIIAWKLAARKRGYFNSLVFKQLPSKGSEDYLAIMEERAALLEHFWRIACQATQNDELVDLPTDPNELKELKKTTEYRAALRQQRQMLSNLIETQEKTQRAATEEAWNTALDELQHHEALGDIPKRGTKRFKERMTDADWKDKYLAVKAKQREIMGL